MPYQPDNPLMIQSDMTVLLEVDHPEYDDIRNRLGAFAELEKSPEHLHTYRISALSLWNAAAAGMDVGEICSFLESYSKFDIPPNVIRQIEELFRRYGILRLEKSGNAMVLVSREPEQLDDLLRYDSLKPYFRQRISADRVEIDPAGRGKLKQELTLLGFPVEDLAGYADGTRASGFAGAKRRDPESRSD